LLFGLIEFTSSVTSSLGFHSAGVTTQSSIYLGLVIIASLGLLVDDTERPLLVTFFLCVSLYLMGIAMLYMGSRGAIFAVVVCLTAVLLLMHSRRLILISSSLIIAITVSALFLISTYPTNINKPNKRERFSVERFQQSDSERLQNWHIAIKKLSTGKDLVWGIGPKNYRTIDPADLGIESSFYQRTGKLSHAHNLFLTQWVEQGIIGLLAMFVFFGLVFRRLIQRWPLCRDSSGLGGLVVPVVAGFFNTPFYQEHAMLAMILLGAMYAETKKLA
jgi:O-antigen ligase